MFPVLFEELCRSRWSPSAVRIGIPYHFAAEGEDGTGGRQYYTGRERERGSRLRSGRPISTARKRSGLRMRRVLCGVCALVGALSGVRAQSDEGELEAMAPTPEGMFNAALVRHTQHCCPPP